MRLMVAVIALAAGVAHAQRPTSPEFVQALRWLPPDTETLMVGTSHSIFIDFERAPVVSLVPSQEIALIVRGFRNFRTPPTVRSMSGHEMMTAGVGPISACTIAFLLNPNSRSLQALQQTSGFQATSEGVAVYQIPALAPASASPDVWAQPRPGILVSCGERKMLDEVLARIVSSPEGEAMPPSVEAWPYVPPTDGLWFIRRIQPGEGFPGATGLSPLAFRPALHEENLLAITGKLDDRSLVIRTVFRGPIPPDARISRDGEEMSNFVSPENFVSRDITESVYEYEILPPDAQLIGGLYLIMNLGFWVVI